MITYHRVMMLSAATLLCAAVARAATPTTIDIDNFSFSPATVTVSVGTTVVWKNHDDEAHTVVDADAKRLFKSAPLDTDESFSFVFKSPGTYHYFCSIHPQMQATIVVE